MNQNKWKLIKINDSDQSNLITIKNMELILCCCLCGPAQFRDGKIKEMLVKPYVFLTFSVSQRARREPQKWLDSSHPGGSAGPERSCPELETTGKIKINQNELKWIKTD